MKLTLRSARKLDTKIANHLLKKLDFEVEISAYDMSSIEHRINKANVRLTNDTTEYAKLILIRGEIRRAIQKQNETSGINTLIALRKQQIDLLDFWKEVKSYADLRSVSLLENGAVVRGKLEAMKEGKASRYGELQDRVVVSAVSDELADEVNVHVKEMEVGIELIDDQLLDLNTSTTVVLTDEDSIVIRDAGITISGAR